MNFYKVIRLNDGQAVTGYCSDNVSFLPNKPPLAFMEEEATELIKFLRKRFPYIYNDNLSYEELPNLQK